MPRDDSKDGTKALKRARLRAKKDPDSKTRTKKDYIDGISARTGIPRSVVKTVLQEILDQMLDDLRREKRIEFREFGVFEVKKRAQRRAQNPRTLAPVVVPPKRTIKFKPGLRMREALEAAANAESKAPAKAPGNAQGKSASGVEVKPASKTAKQASRRDDSRAPRDGHGVSGARVPARKIGSVKPA
jgi:nucleoid DNA-binding protein